MVTKDTLYLLLAMVLLIALIIFVTVRSESGDVRGSRSEMFEYKGQLSELNDLADTYPLGMWTRRSMPRLYF